MAAGADGSVGQFRAPVAFSDEAAYWPEPIPPSPNPHTDALALLRRSIEAGARIVAVGPYTNLALFDWAFPGLLQRADLYLMGGHVHPARPGFPQWTNDADWNVQYDAAAARHLLEHTTPTLVPIEATAETALRRAYLPALGDTGPLGQLLVRQALALSLIHI